ncbi:MAG: DinB family protein [Ferruginibacter sp.]
MKPILQQFAGYNAWANQKLQECISNLSDAEIHKEIPSSFSSIYKTLKHMWFAEEAWWYRLKLVENPQVEAQQFEGSYTELIQKLNRQSAMWKEWVDNASLPQLEHEFIYRNYKNEQYKQPVYEMLMHLFNHGTYHRGQLVTLLRQLGVDKIPQTDMIVYYRKK